MKADASPLAILQVYAPTEAGGLDRVVEALAAGQARAGHDVTVVAVHPGEIRDVTSVQRLRRAPVRLHEVVIAPRAYAAEWRNMRKLCRMMRPQIVHTHGARCDFVDGLAARSLSVPTVTTLHGRTGGGLKWRVFEWMQHRAIRHFDAIVAVSSAQVEYLAADGFRADKLRLIPNAYSDVGAPLNRAEARRRLGASPEPPLIGWVGRLSLEKGPDVFLEAVAQLRDVSLQAAVIGEGAASGSLRSRARTLDLGDRIHWHGTIPNAALLFPAFDLFVLSSRTEGTPIVLLEAMAQGIPVIATAVGGVPAMVSTKEAVLVPAENPQALAQAIRYALTDRTASRERALRAQERVRTAYALEPWVEAHEVLYREVLADRALRR